MLFVVCPTGGCPLSNPGRGFSSPPAQVQHAQKKARICMRALLRIMAVRGGLTRFARPSGSPLMLFVVCPTGSCPLSHPGRGFSSPLRKCNMRKKSPHLHASSSSNNGGEGGIRTPDTLPYTHFPGVLLQPLGHLTTLSSRCHRDGR